MTTATERAAELKYLESLPNRTLDQTINYILLRMKADGTKDDAKLSIVYSEAGAFRRTLARDITGHELYMLLLTQYARSKGLDV